MKRFAAAVPILLTVLLAASSGRIQAAPMPRVGMLCVPACGGPSFDPFWQELRELGWVDGTTVVIDRKEAGSQLDELPALAADLVRSKPDVVVTVSPQAARAAKNATSQIPIVMTFLADPVGMGLASSLAHPGGNATGVATLVPGDFNGKVLEIIRVLLPRARRVAAFINPSNDVHRLLYPTEAPAAADKLDFQLETFELRDADEIPAAVSSAKARGAEALFVLADPIFNFPPNRLPDLALHAGLPSIFFFRSLAQAGGLMSYGPDYPALARLGAHYVDRILKGAKPAELPIEQPSRFQFVINLKTARSLGLEVPVSLLVRADEVIE
jgi:putative tryptophan/tyrosine transport system substrate-binding protein